MKLKNLLFLLFLLASADIAAQDLQKSYEDEIAFRKTGMMVLGSWAAMNIAGGLALRGNTSGTSRYFHEMNAIWNGVNLAIAAFGYYSAVNLAQPETGLELFKEQASMDKTLLFNAGLDLAYIAGGLYLNERSRRGGDNSQRLKGYGNSIIMQGAFLFIFDLAMVWVHSKVKISDGAILSFNALPGKLQLALVF